MSQPPAITDAAIETMQGIVGSANVLTSGHDLLRFAVDLDPDGDVFPAAVVRPGSAEEVQEVVLAANRTRCRLHPVSRGMQHGLGMATAVEPGGVTVDLGRLTAIRDYDEALGLVVVEPGVTFQQLYDFLRERDAPYWMSPISGPVDASVIGNALDKGAGYIPVGAHFNNLIGLDVVLGDGRRLRTGDGAMDGARTSFTHKAGCGPILEGLFAQSNLGIVVASGLWLMPKPPAATGFVYSVDSYDDLAPLVDVAGRLKLSGAIPSTVSIVNEQFCIAVEASTPYPSGAPGRPPFAGAELERLREEHDLGAWSLIGCVYGAPGEQDQKISMIGSAINQVVEARYIDEETARTRRAYGYRFDIAKGIPNEDELSVYGLHANGSSVYFLPAVPFRGADAKEAMELSRQTCERFGFAYTTQFLCSPRSMRNTQPIVFDSHDAEQRERVVRCYAELVDRFEQAGFLVSRTSPRFQDRVASSLGLTTELACELKQIFDPNGILTPGRYGMRLPGETSNSHGK